MRAFSTWPAASVTLLLRAALAPEEVALPAWRRWAAGRRADGRRPDGRGGLAGISQHEIKLLSALGPRLARLEPEAPLRHAVEACVRQHWLYMQMKLREAFPALDALASAGIPVMVFKGGAQYAEGLAAQSRRLMGDLDLLVPADRSGDALGVLDAEGWEHVEGTSVSYLKTAEPALRNGNLRKGPFGEIDFHLSPFHHARTSPGLEAALWERAVPATLAGRQVLIPAPTDALLITLAHGARGQGGGWAVDVMARLARQVVDWDGLVASARERGLVLPCRSCLVYLQRELGAPVPADVVAALRASPVSLGQTLKHRAYVRDWGSRRLIDRVGDRAANWLLRREGFAPVVDGRPLKPLAGPRWRRARARATRPVIDEPGFRHEVELGLPAGRGACAISIRAEPLAERREVCIEVFAGGRSLVRLGFACGGARGGDERCFRFRVRPDGAGPVTLTLNSRPLAYMEPNLSIEERRRIEPLPFRVTGAWWCDARGD